MSANTFPILGGHIIVTKRDHDWYATIPSQPGAWGAASTIDAAIGMLVRVHANELLALIAPAATTVNRELLDACTSFYHITGNIYNPYPATGEEIDATRDKAAPLLLALGGIEPEPLDVPDVVTEEGA